MSESPALGPIEAAGGIVIRSGKAGFSVALVHRPRHEDWSFPKGKLEPGETHETCALREVEEETGLVCSIAGFAGTTSYDDRHGRLKVVHYWVMSPKSGAFAPSEEVDEMTWVDLRSASGALSYSHDKALLAAVAFPIYMPSTRSA